jgi:hypothetical protein
MKSKPSRFRGLRWALAVLGLGLTAPLAATSPTTPYERLEQRAAREGASAVRGEYRRATDEILAQLAQLPEPRSLAESLRRNLQTVWLHQFLRSWARVEARDVRAGKTSDSLAEALVMPLVDCLEQGHARIETDLAELERLRAEAPAEERARLGLAVSPTTSFERDRLLALRQVALLAKLGRNGAALERVFEMSGGQVDSCATPDEFLAFPHDWDSALGTASPAGGDGGVQ